MKTETVWVVLMFGAPSLGRIDSTPMNIRNTPKSTPKCVVFFMFLFGEKTFDDSELSSSHSNHCKLAYRPFSDPNHHITSSWTNYIQSYPGRSWYIPVKFLWFYDSSTFYPHICWCKIHPHLVSIPTMPPLRLELANGSADEAEPWCFWRRLVVSINGGYPK